MYFKGDLIERLSALVKDNVPYHQVEKRAKKIYVLPEPHMRDLAKLLNPRALPKAMGGFHVRVNSKSIALKPIWLEVKLIEDDIIMVNCYHPHHRIGQELTLFIKIKENNTTEHYMMIPMDEVDTPNLDLIIDIEKNNANLIETIVISVIFGIQQGVFQKCGNSTYCVNATKMKKQLNSFVDIPPHERIVNGKKISVKGYRRYKA